MGGVLPEGAKYLLQRMKPKQEIKLENKLNTSESLSQVTGTLSGAQRNGR
jgi:hypothetical protein